MGRTRIYPTNAARQAAYRVRKAEAQKAQDKADKKLTFVPYVPVKPSTPVSTPGGESAA